MKTLFDNGECIILWDNGKGSSKVTRVTKHIGWDRLQNAYEVWTYCSSRQIFIAYKNRGDVNEILHRMSELGINLKISSSSLDTAVVKELRFATDKDKFHFQLKF